MKFFYIIGPILAFLPLVGVYIIKQANDRPIPRYDSGSIEDDWSPEEYYNHLNVKNFDEREVHKLLIKRTKQKQGVYLENLEPAMDSAGIEIVNVFHQVLGDDYTPVITSGNDWPYHAKKSKHYQNKAIDFRIKYIPLENRRKIVDISQKRLKGRFRVLWEKGDAEHLHIELLD